LTVSQKDAIVFGIENAYSVVIVEMKSFAQSSLLLWKPVFRLRAELFRVLILLVLIIITGVAVTPGASG
jgi:hypothetical protein